MASRKYGVSRRSLALVLVLLLMTNSLPAASMAGSQYNVTLYIERVFAASWHPRGDRIATACVDGGLEMYDAASGRRLYRLSDEEVWGDGMGAPRANMAWSPDGRFLATRMGLGDRVIVWAIDTAKQIYSLQWKGGSPVAFSPDGRWLAGITSDGGIQLWDTSTGALTTTLPGRNMAQNVTVLTWSADKTSVLYGQSRSATAVGIAVVETATGKVTFEAPVAGHTLTNAGWTPNGKTIFAVNDYGELNTWDATTGKAYEPRYLGGSVVDFRADGLVLAANSIPLPYGDSTRTANVVNILETNTLQVLAQLPHDDAVDGLAWNPVKDRLLTVTQNQHVLRVWTNRLDKK